MVMADQANIDQLEALEAFKMSGHHLAVLSPLEILISEIISLRARALSSFACSRFLRCVFMSTCLRTLPIWLKSALREISLWMSFPAGNFMGRVTSTARAIDPTSRTLLTELQYLTKQVNSFQAPML